MQQDRRLYVVEDQRRRVIASARDAGQGKRDLFAYIEGYCNRQRLHSAMGYRTPDQAKLQAT